MSPSALARKWRAAPTVFVTIALSAALFAQAGPSTGSVTVRGKTLAVRFYGPPAGRPVVLSSGDGGWIHLAPQAADVLARAGYFVVGIDSREYLSAFTSGHQVVSPADEPGDYRAFAALAARATGAKPILIGVSEGAGLSVLAATDPATKTAVAGVVGLGLPDLNELGWRWKDAIIYVTKGIPNEPTFSVASLIDRVAPLPLAALHSTGDEFVPVSVIQQMMARAQEPKKLWIIEAANHRFSGSEAEFNRLLLESLDWILHRGGQREPPIASVIHQRSPSPVRSIP